MAQSESGVDALLEAAASGQSLEFARAVESMGDAQVVEFLGAGHPVGVRLAAAYASVWVEEPTLVIVALAELAAGRDPDLAPAAAWALWRVAQGFALREPNPEFSPLSPEAVSRVRAIAGDASMRPDLARLLELSCALLAGVQDEDEDAD